MYFVIPCILTTICATLMLLWWLGIKDDELDIIREADKYPIYHWKFLSKRYKVPIIKWTSFTLFIMSASMVICILMVLL